MKAHRAFRPQSSVIVAGVVTAVIVTSGGSPAIAAPDDAWSEGASSADFPSDIDVDLPLDATVEGNEVLKYAALNPTDYVGIDEVSERVYGQPLSFQINGVDEPMPAEAAQEILEDRYEARMADADDGESALLLTDSVRSSSAANGFVRAGSVPLDAYTVGFFWAPTSGKVGFATGTWDFRDNYVNGSAPDDIATIGVQLSPCLSVGSTTIISRDYTKKSYPGSVYIRDVGLNGSPVAGIRDQTSGFVMNSDNGVMTTQVLNGGSCGATPTRGQFIYEKNQDGGSLLGLSAGFGFLSISYSGSPRTLQKSAGPVGFTIP